LPAWGGTGAAPKDFRGIPWGGTVPDTLIKSTTAGDGGKVEVFRNRAKEPTPFLGVPVAEEAYYFTRGKLTGGQLFYRGEDTFSRLKDSLVKLYGVPKNLNPEFYRWEWPDTQTVLTIAYNKKFKYTTLSMTSTPGLPPVSTLKKKAH